MNPLIDVRAAAPGAIAATLGQSLKAQVKQAGTITRFVEKTGLSRSALYRLFNGEPVGVDVLITTLQGLGRSDALTVLIAPPQINPVSLITAAKAPKTKQPTRPMTLQLAGLARPTRNRSR